MASTTKFKPSKCTIHDVIDALEEALDAAEEFADGSELECGGGKQAAVEAINHIRRGEYSEAVTTLEREFLPKWADKNAAQRAYDSAMKHA